jgi:hypothetical protein
MYNLFVLAELLCLLFISGRHIHTKISGPHSATLKHRDWKISNGMSPPSFWDKNPTLLLYTPFSKAESTWWIRGGVWLEKVLSTKICSGIISNLPLQEFFSTNPHLATLCLFVGMDMDSSNSWSVFWWKLYVLQGFKWVIWFTSVAGYCADNDRKIYWEVLCNTLSW